MVKRIFRSMFLITSAILILGMGLIMGVLYRFFISAEYKQLSMQTAMASQGVALSGMDYFTGLDSRGYRITWIDSDGTVLYDNEKDATTMENHANREEVIEALSSGHGQSERHSAMMSEMTLYSANKVSDGTVIRVSVTQNSILVLLWGMLWPLAVILFLALILTLLVSNRLAERIVKPLNEIDLEHPLDNDTYEEVAPLLTRMEKQHREITKKEEELVRRQTEFASVTNNMSEALIVLNSRYIVLSMNQSAKDLYKVDDSSVEVNFLNIDHSLSTQSMLEEALKGNRSDKEEEISGRTYRVSVSPAKSGGIVILVLDITDTAEAENMRREFTANVSHELKTPIQTIMGSAELIQNGMIKQEDIPTWAGKIRTEAERLVVLINDIIELSRLDEDEKQAEAIEMDLRDEARVSVESLKEKAEINHITIRTDLNAAPILGVQQLIHEITYNLVDNAIKYNKAGGYVDVRTYTDSDESLLVVSDTGIGIKKEDQLRVFERFYRVDKSHSREIGGTGLGLSIVKHAASYHHAKIDMTSELGKGTTIKVRFKKYES